MAIQLIPPRAATAPPRPYQVELRELDRSADWAALEGSLVASLRDSAAYYAVSGEDDPIRGADAALDALRRHSPPEVYESVYDVLSVYRVRTALDMRAAGHADYDQDDDEIVLDELRAVQVVWDPSEPPCREEHTQVEHAVHRWREDEIISLAGAMIRIHRCSRCECWRHMDDGGGDGAEGPSVSYYERDSTTPILRPGVLR